MSLEKVLQSLGLDETEIQNLQSNPEDLTPFQTKIQDSIKSRLLEDETFYPTLDKNKLPKEWFEDKFKEGINKFAGETKSSIDKHFGLTAEDKAKFVDEDTKSAAKYAAKAAAIYKEKLAGAGNDVAKIQDENISLKARIEELNTQMTGLQEKFESDLTEKLTAGQLEAYSLIEASSLQENVPVKIGLIWDKAFNSIKSKYAVIVENGAASLRKKDNISFKVNNPNDTTKHLTLKDALEIEFKGMGAWIDKQQPNQPGANVRVDITPGSSAASQKIKDKAKEEEAFFGM